MTDEEMLAEAKQEHADAVEVAHQAYRTWEHLRRYTMVTHAKLNALRKKIEEQRKRPSDEQPKAL